MTKLIDIFKDYHKALNQLNSAYKKLDEFEKEAKTVEDRGLKNYIIQSKMNYETHSDLNVYLHGLEAQLKGLQEDKGNLENMLVDSETQIETLKAKITEMNEKLEPLASQTEREELEMLLQELQENEQETQAELTDLKSEIQSVEVLIPKNWQEVKDVEEKMPWLKTRMFTMDQLNVFQPPLSASTFNKYIDAMFAVKNALKACNGCIADVSLFKAKENPDENELKKAEKYRVNNIVESLALKESLETRKIWNVFHDRLISAYLESVEKNLEVLDSLGGRPKDDLHLNELEEEVAKRKSEQRLFRLLFPYNLGGLLPENSYIEYRSKSPRTEEKIKGIFNYLEKKVESPESLVSLKGMFAEIGIRDDAVVAAIHKAALEERQVKKLF